ncbi:MAG: class I SAM-dependent methyltransferase [Planctomycetota bacterium]
MTEEGNPTAGGFDPRADVRGWNRHAWDRQVAKGNEWTRPVDAERVAAARRGEISVLLTPETPVPSDWLEGLAGKDVLALACGGGQQVPLFAAAGARVTVLDNSPSQLARDREVAEREGLEIRTVEGDMRRLDAFEDESFDLVFNPCSVVYVPSVLPVWREAYRVLRDGGRFLTGWTNPARMIFDEKELEAGRLAVRHAIPYSDVESLRSEEVDDLVARDEPLMFGHSLDDLIGGQLAAGFVIDGFFEDRGGDALDAHLMTYAATRAFKR